ncbi:MAG: hypothetical protein AB9873_16390 [Syntrophobacteraceae bacterium]
MSAIPRKTVQQVLPVISYDSLAPPYLEYEYFKESETHPFRPHATVFDMQNAWWLIEASTLAYAEPDFAIPIFKAAGLPEVRFFNGSATDTQCYVAGNDQFLIVAFRGTEIRKRKGVPDFQNIVRDLSTDFAFGLVDSKQGGKVHRGFKEGLDEVWDKRTLDETLDEEDRCKDEGGLCKYLNDRAHSGRTIWFTGHSLGAALATLAADRFGNVQGLYTFGSPRVGDAEFKNDFQVSAYRFVNNNDIVARVPPPGLYCHVGELKYIDGEGLIHDNTNRWERITDGIADKVKSVFNAVGQIRSGFGRLVPDGLVDHVPLLYAVHIWNSIP